MAEETLPFDPIAEARRNWEERWGSAPARRMAAVASVMRVQQILLARLNAALRPLDLTFARYEALMLLSFTKRGSIPLGVMGRRLQVHRASVTNIVDRLEAAGYLVRRPGGSDRRSTLAEITAEGRAVAAQGTAILNALNFTVPGLDDEDLETLNGILAKARAQAGDFEPS